MFSEWKQLKWGDVATLEYGKALRDYEESKGKYPVYGTNGLIGHHDEPLCNSNGVIIGRKGAYRGVHYSKIPFFVIDTAFYLKPKIKDLDLRFAYYQLLTHDINSMDSGSAIPSTSRSEFYNLDVKLPSFEEQKNIANTLGTLDDKIELNAKMNKILEAIVEAVFKRWFVDFEFPNEEGKPYESSGGEMADSEIGLIPKDWSVLNNIFEACDLINYGYTQSASTEEVGPRFLRVMDINKADWIDWNNVPFCEISEKDKPKYLLKKKDIVIARMADPGKIAIFESDFDVVFASYLIRIRLKSPSLAYYFYYLMKSSYYQNFIEGAATGSVQKNLNAKSLTTGLQIAVPSKETTFLFNSIVENLRAKVNCSLVESTALAKIRDGLLPKLMSGKIRVPIDNKMERQ